MTLAYARLADQKRARRYLGNAQMVFQARGKPGLSGETLVILGISGSGKSTILKLTAGLLRPQSGRVWVKGADMTDAPESVWRQVRPQIGYVFQEGALFDSMTVGENIGYTLLEHTDQSLDEIEVAVRETLRFLNLSENLIDVLPDELSGPPADVRIHLYTINLS